MLSCGGHISQEYGWELTLFHKLRAYRDGITFLEVHINWDRYQADHCPRFTVHLILCNVTVFEWHIYYLHHRDRASQ